MHPHPRPARPTRRRASFALALGLILSLGALAACEPDDIGTLPDPQAPDAPDVPEAQADRRVPLQVLEGPGGQVIIVVQVFINGEGPFDFALDTGASRSLVDGAIAEQLGLEVTQEDIDVLGVGGQTQVDLVEVETWRMGDTVDLPASTLAVIDLPAPERGSGLEGLLGSDQLAGFGTIFIDFDQGFMVVEAGLASPGDE
jgi:hypothetical protein